MPVAQAWLVLALAAQTGLIFFLLFYSGFARVAAVRRKEATERDFELLENLPARLRQLGAAVNNSFQMPILFFVAGLLALATGAATLVMAVLAWIFFASRLLHAAVFLTSNKVALRFPAFAIGAIACLVMWVIIVLRVLAVAG